MSPKPSTEVLLTYSLPLILLTYYIKLHISTGGVNSYLLNSDISAKYAPIYVYNRNNLNGCRQNGYMSGLADW